jgi:hypothetical protein
MELTVLISTSVACFAYFFLHPRFEMGKGKNTKTGKGIMTMRNTHSDELSEVTVNKDIHSIRCAYQKCQELFTPRRSWQKFCTRQCKDRYWQEIRQEVAVVIKKRAQIQLEATE